jgi:hypothetical protein
MLSLHFRYPFCIRNLPDVTVALQLHTGSKSQSQRGSAAADSLAVRTRLVRHMLRGGEVAERAASTCSKQSMRVISHPHLASTSEELIRSCEYLKEIFELFCLRLPQHLSTFEIKQLLLDQMSNISLKLISAGCSALSCGDVKVKSQCCQILDVDMSALMRYELMYLVSSSRPVIVS